MIWINISNILTNSKFTGIIRTEYELCTYAYECYTNGMDIGFCTYQENLGFIEIHPEIIYKRLQVLKYGNEHLPILVKKINRRISKFKRSVSKRINQLKSIFYNGNSHCFHHGDTILSVGQRLNTDEMITFAKIKQKVKIDVRLLVHDLMPINHSEFVVNENVYLFQKYINEAIIALDFIYCNSEYTKNELIDYYHKVNFPLIPMQVVTLGCDFRQSHKPNNIHKYIEFITKEKYLLFVSTIEVRKNHQLIYDMYIELIEEGFTNLPKIYFVGRRGWKVDSLLEKLDNDKRIKDKIIILDNISDNDLITLYNNCWFTIYPSYIEGYGLPIAECLSFGKYCLSSNAGSLPEAGGEFIDYINPYDLKAWKKKFLFLINNPNYIVQKEQYIQTHYKATTWQECVKKILDSIQQVE